MRFVDIARLAKTYAAVFLVIATSTGHAVVIRHDVSDKAYVELASEERFAGVGQMHSSFGLRGTGTYIGNGWILTAAHVADDDDSWTFRLAGVDYAVADFQIHPFWTGDQNDNYDVALMKLSEQLIGVNPLPIAKTSAAVGDSVEFAGYGFTGTGLTGITNDGGQILRAGTNTIEFDLSSFGLEYIVTFFDSPGSGLETPFEAQGAFNDSGGPLLRESNGNWEIVGVTSFIQESLDGSGDGILGNYGDLTGFANVPLYNVWINEITSPIVGDVNEDGAVNLLDVAPFVELVADNQYQLEADINCDGAVNLLDVNPFVQLLSSS